MTITREQVAGLMEGDTVELVLRRFEKGYIAVRGALKSRSNGMTDGLWLDDYCVRDFAGKPVYGDKRELVVISRVPRPLYVNHPRGEPVKGDVVRSVETQNTGQWMFTGSWWRSIDGTSTSQHELPKQLRLLVDGETREVVAQ